MTVWEGPATSVCHRGSRGAANPLFGRIKGTAQGQSGRGRHYPPRGMGWTGSGGSCPVPHRWVTQGHVLVSKGRWSKFSPTGGLKTTEIYFLPVLGATGLKSRCPKAHLLVKTPGEPPNLLPLLGAPGVRWLVAVSL